MKICLFADGESIHTLRWCNYFLEHGHEVHLISFKKVNISQINTYFVGDGNINVSGGNWKLIFHFREVKKILKDIKPDIFHAHYATSYGITGALCNFHPFVITALGSDVLITPNQSKIVKILLKWALKRADWITSMADHMTEKITSMISEPEKTYTLPFGIDTDVFKETDNRKPLSDFTFISTRNFEDVYNISHLIKSFQGIHAQIPNAKLILIGAGSKRNEIESLVKELGLTQQVDFKGKLTQPEIAKELNAAHVFVTVSKSDGNNISLNEAMACGTLCIATCIPANVQWIKNGENGFLVDIDDVEGLTAKMLVAYNEYESIQPLALQMNRKIIAEKANWKTNMSFVLKKYNELIAAK